MLACRHEHLASVPQCRHSENGNEIKEKDAVEFPDGSIAKPLTDEEAQATLEAIRAEKEAKKKAAEE